MAGMSTQAQTEHSTDTDDEQLPLETLRDLVELDDELREKTGEFIVTAVAEGHDIDAAERHALERLLDKQFYDTDNFVAPTDDPAFH